MAAGGKIRSSGGKALQIARSQAARLLRTVLRDDHARLASASIKSLIYRPSVQNKKATMALLCQTLKYLPIIKRVLEGSDLLKNKGKVHEELIYVMTFELLFGKEQLASGRLEDLVLSRKASLRATLARILIKENVQCVEDLLPTAGIHGGPAKYKYVRVNTLKIEVEEALESLGKLYKVGQDDIVPGLIILPAEADLHNHPLLLNGSLILQGKSSCIPALALAPQEDWVVLDACSAPGNKTVQLAALMNGKGTVLACEINDQRIKRLRETVKISGASNVEVWHQDFLKLNLSNSLLSQVKAILLDPSCSGSGTVHRRMDHLLPSFTDEKEDVEVLDSERLEKLALFQEKALRFALSFNSVERIVYSTCSVHQRENEDVIKAVLEHATKNGFRLGCPIPKWPHRGLPVFEEAQNLIRIEPSEDMDGFFVALFERQESILPADTPLPTPCGDNPNTSTRRGHKKRKRKDKDKKLLSS